MSDRASKQVSQLVDRRGRLRKIIRAEVFKRRKRQNVQRDEEVNKEISNGLVGLRGKPTRKRSGSLGLIEKM